MAIIAIGEIHGNLEALDDFSSDSNPSFVRAWLLGMEALDTIASYSPPAAEVMRRAMREAGASLFENDCPLPYDSFFAAMPTPHLDLLRSLQLVHAANGAMGVLTALRWPDLRIFQSRRCRWS